MAEFTQFAGQMVASGIRPNGPVVALESNTDPTVFQNLQKVNGLMPKLSRVIFRETRVFNNPLDRIFKKGSLPFGVGWEDAQFIKGATNKKTDGTCFPYGNVKMEPQINMKNLDWNIPITIYDREINNAVLTEPEVGSYVAQKMRTQAKTYSMMRYKAMLQLLSDVVDGTRTIASTENSDGTGTVVTYNPSIKGYAGKVTDTNIVMPELTVGTIPEFANASDATDFVKLIENTSVEMREESTEFSKLGIETFVLEKPYLIMESKVLNALDNALALDGADKRIPTRDAREFLSKYTEIVEIPSKFAELPTNNTYASNRLGAVMIDRDSFTEMIAWENVESMRCVNERATGYSFAGATAISIYKGNPACAILFDKS